MTAPAPTRVLVIDDDAMSRELLAMLLEAEGYAVDSAESGEGALDLLRHAESVPDLVLADVQMPGTTGARLAARLRGACGPATLLLAISGSQPPLQVIAPFDGFLMKPFKMEQVAAALLAHQQALQLKSSPSKLTPASVSESETAPNSVKRIPLEEERSAATTGETTVADADGGDDAVLNENIYRQLADSIPVPQLQEMYLMCVDDARRRIAGMRRFAADRDSDCFIREAHAIKGGCGLLGATELHRLAAQLEASGLRTAPGDATGKVNSLDELSAACDRLERMLGSRA